jgi:sortase A
MSSASKSMARRAATWIERCLWAIGFVALAVWLAAWGNSQWQQTKGRHELDRLSSYQQGSALVPSAKQKPPRLGRGDLIGRIEIPRLQISTVIFEGTDGSVLRDGAGHLTGSALPDQKGNVVLAAHRDSFFRPLRNIQKLDAIQLITPSGTKNYRVESTEIVDPDRADVIAPTRDSELTLITCYPFDWWGHAPQRFIVRARQVNDPTPMAAKALPVKTLPFKAARPKAAKPRVIAEDTVEPAEEEIAAPEIAIEQVVETANETPPIQNNLMIRGLKKINPKRWIAKLAGS